MPRNSGPSCLPPELLIGSAIKRFSVQICSEDERVFVQPIVAMDGEAAMARGLELLDAQPWWHHRPVVSVQVQLIRELS